MTTLGPIDPRQEPLGNLSARIEPGEGRRAGAASGPGFAEMLGDGLMRVSELQGEVKQKTQDLVTGKTDDVHGVLLAMGKAEVAFTMMLEVRNKLVDAWREVTRISV